MGDSVSAARENLRKTRKQKQRQRSIRSMQGVWRSLALMGLASAAVWITTRPEWILYSSEQIKITGNQVLSTATVRTLIPLKYPQSLLSLKPQRLEEEIETTGPIAEAIVSRQLLPPSLSIQVQERLPVARATAPISPTTQAQAFIKGYLDEQGNWLPETAYGNVNNEMPLPTLEVLGLRAIQVKQWRDIYPVIMRSPTKITNIDWRNTNNLILNTEKGQFHLGDDLTQLEQQVMAIAKFASLDTAVMPQAIDYIDLSDPDEPIIKTQTIPKPAP